MPITAVSNIADLVTDYTIDPNAASGGTVLTSRRVDTTAPITGGGDLSANLNLALTTSPAGQTPVGTTRLISTTAPITGGGDLSANRTFAMDAHNGSVDGYVVKNAAGIQGKFYRDDGSWQSGTVTGVSSVIAGAGIAVSAATGDVTVSGLLVGIANQGEAPATGGADSTKFLCATNPATWVVPGSGVFIKLQGSYPGTADVGNGHITGSFGAQTAIVAGSDKKSLNGTGNENFYVKQGTPANVPVIASYFAGSPGTGLLFRAARGTEAAPGTTQSGDTLARLKIEAYAPTPAFAAAEFLSVVQVGAGNSSRVPYSVQLIAVGGTVTPVSSSIYLGTSAFGGVNTVTPLSGWEIGTSLGLKTVVKTAATYTLTESDYLVFGDCTSNAIELTLPTAIGCTGRLYEATKIDSTSHNLTIITTGGQTISGMTGLILIKQAQTLRLISDGANWRIVGAYDNPTQLTQFSDGSALASSVTDTQISTSSNYGITNLAAGSTFGIRASGKFSTTGTPTLRFRVKNNNAGVIADSGARTTPSAVTNAIWQLECEWVIRSIVGGMATIRPTKGVLHWCDGNNIISSFNMSLVAPPASTTPTADDIAVWAEWGTSSPSNTLVCIEYQSFQSPFAFIN